MRTLEIAYPTADIGMGLKDLPRVFHDGDRVELVIKGMAIKCILHGVPQNYAASQRIGSGEELVREGKGDGIKNALAHLVALAVKLEQMHGFRFVKVPSAVNRIGNQQAAVL